MIIYKILFHISICRPRNVHVLVGNFNFGRTFHRYKLGLFQFEFSISIKDYCSTWRISTFLFRLVRIHPRESSSHCNRKHVQGRQNQCSFPNSPRRTKTKWKSIRYVTLRYVTFRHVMFVLSIYFSFIVDWRKSASALVIWLSGIVIWFLTNILTVSFHKSKYRIGNCLTTMDESFTSGEPFIWKITFASSRQRNDCGSSLFPPTYFRARRKIP